MVHDCVVISSCRSQVLPSGQPPIGPLAVPSHPPTMESGKCPGPQTGPLKMSAQPKVPLVRSPSWGQAWQVATVIGVPQSLAIEQASPIWPASPAVQKFPAVQLPAGFGPQSVASVAAVQAAPIFAGSPSVHVKVPGSSQCGGTSQSVLAVPAAHA